MTTGFVGPGYHQSSLVDVLPAVSVALGVDAGLHRPDLVLPESPRYVVFLIDGLGLELLRDHPEEAPFLHSLIGEHTTGTAGVPTTTATSLTSLGTALPPGAHGVVGYTSRIPGTEQLLNALKWSADVDPLEWQPHPTAFDRLAAAGVHTTVVNKRDFQLGADDRRPPRSRLRRGRQGGGAAGRGPRGLGVEPLADLHVRR
jgi:hypothetical protein